MTGVPSITSARPSRTLDRRTRSRRYVLTMAVRMACLALALIVSGPWRWVFAAGAIALPYFAVVLANVSARRMSAGIDEIVEPHAIEAARAERGPAERGPAERGAQ